MKKTMCFFVLLLGSCFLFPASLSFVAGGEVKGLEKKEEKKKIAWDGGLKVSLSFIEGCFFAKEEKFAYGLLLKTNEVSFGSGNKNYVFSVDLKSGMILKNGFLTYLGNPCLSSTVSPFFSEERSFSMMNAALPGVSSSFNTRHSAFLETKLKFGKWDFSNGVFYCPFRTEMKKESSLIAGAFLSTWTPEWKILPKLKIQSGAVYGNGGYEEKKSDSWYGKDSFYQEGRASSALVSFRIGTGSYGGKPEFWLYFHSMFFENPFNKVNHAFRTDIVFGYGGFSFNSELFYNPQNGLFTLEGKTLDPQISGKGKVSQKIIFGKGKTFSITTGIAGFWKENLLYKEDDLKLAGGIRFSFLKTVFTLSAINEWNTIEIKRNGFSEVKLKPSLFSASADFVFNPKYISMELNGTYSKEYEKDFGEWKSGLSIEGGVSFVKTQIRMETEFTKEKLKSAKISLSVSGKI